jgi:hypothetical protein
MTAWIPPIVDSSRVAWADSLYSAAMAAPSGGEYEGIIVTFYIVAAVVTIAIVGLIAWGVYSIAK